MAAHLPIAAGIGVEGIIWLIILIFWGIAQAIQKSRRSGPGAPPRRAPIPIDDDLREMLEQLTGQPSAPPRPTTRTLTLEEDVDEEAPAPPPPPPPPIRARAPTLAQQRHRHPAPPPPARTRPAPPSPPAIRPQDEAAYADLTPSISAEHFAEAGAALRSGLNAPGLSMRMKGMSLQGMATMPSGSMARQRGRPMLDLAELKNPATLRRAVLAKVILDPPRGLSPYAPFGP